MIPLPRLLFLSLTASQLFSMGLSVTMWSSDLSFTSFLAGAFFVALGVGSYLGLFFFCHPKRPTPQSKLAATLVVSFTAMWFFLSLAVPAVNKA